MGDNKEKSALWKKRLTEKAEKWFDAVNDAIPFNAFKSVSEKERIGTDIYSNILIGIKRKNAKRRILYAYAKAAAVILLVSSFSFIFYKVRMSPDANDQQSWITVRSGDHVKKLVLPDKSIVYLNSNTLFKYPKAFTKNLRKVELVEGEAFFSVTHNKKSPFIVQSAALSTKVLGTRFNVEAYRHEAALKVSLVQGKVTIHNNDSPHAPDQVLTPGRMLSYDAKSKLTKVGTIAVVNVSAWINSGLVFNDVTMEDALNRISTFYHISIRQDAALKLTEKHVTGSYDHQTIDEVLTAILLVHNLNYQRKGGIIYVSN